MLVYGAPGYSYFELMLIMGLVIIFILCQMCPISHPEGPWFLFPLCIPSKPLRSHIYVAIIRCLICPGNKTLCEILQGMTAFSLSGAETEIFWDNQVNTCTIAADALAPCIAQWSPGIVLTKINWSLSRKDFNHLPSRYWERRCKYYYLK